MTPVLMFATRNRVLASLILLAMTVLLASGIPKLKIDTRLELLLDRQGSEYNRYQEAMKLFGSDNKTIFFIRDAALFTPEKLEILQSLVDELDALDAVEKVDSLFSLTSIRDRDGWLESRAMIEFLPDTQEEADQILKDALYSPLVKGNFATDSGDITAITVTVRPPLPDERDLDGHTYEVFEAIIDRYAVHFHILFHAGNLRVGNDLRVFLKKDLSTLGPISIVVLFMMVGLLLRNMTMSLLPVFTSVMGTVWTFGFMGHVDIPVNLLTAMLPTLLLVIGATEDIHLSSAFVEAYDVGEATDRQGAVHYMASHMATAVVITAFTTSIGFVSNAFSNLQIIQHFAIVASFGIVANAVTTFLSVPLLLSLLGPQPGTSTAGGSEARQQIHGVSRALRAFADVCVRTLYDKTNRYPVRVATVTILLIVISGVILSRVKVNTDPMTFFPEDSQIITDTNMISDTLSGVLTFFITIDGGKDRAFTQPEYLERLHELVTTINQQGIFDRAVAHTEHLSLVNQEMHGGDPAFYHPPDSQDLAEQYLMFFQRSDLESYLAEDARHANVVVRYSIYGSERALEEIERLKVMARQILGPDMSVEIVGKYVLVNAASRQLVKNEIKAVLVIISVIFVVMWLLYGSWRAGIVSLMPNLIPIMFTFAIMVLVGIEVNPATAMVAGVVIGVAIDDTTHFLTRFNAECRKSDDMNAVIRRVVRAEAVPVIVSSLALGAGFSILIASQFTLTREFGFLAAIAMLLALLTEFIVTPLLMRNLWMVNVWDLMTVKLPMDVLKRSPLFKGLSFFQIRKLILLSRERTCISGENISGEAEFGEEMFVVVEGGVSLQYEGSSDTTTCGVGDLVSEVGFLGQGFRTATLVADQDTRLLVLNQNTIARRLHLYPYIATTLNNNMANLLGHQLDETTAAAPG